ncbi:MAG TPA: alpha/beta hydrolase [Streptosporangiaceae bacterium]|jgi:pimeloyl-ACP methyl ester carboxylesterase|nr:alpha/beta hydrolase [Streptosporangiaceae bacterium]
MYIVQSASAIPRRLGGLAVDDHGTADGRTPLVLLHGMTFDRRTWRPLVDLLQQADPGRRTLVIDLPGHGESPEQARYDLAEVPAQLHGAIEEAGLTSPVIVGHSAGALAATVYAARFPVSGVVNVDQPLQLGEFAAFVRSMRDRLEGPAFAATFQQFWESFHTERLPADARDLVRATFRPRQQVVTGFWREIMHGSVKVITDQTEQALSAIGETGVPYLHIAGEELPPGYAEWLTKRIPEATFAVWGGSGHFPHLARPEEFTRILTSTASWPN